MSKDQDMTMSLSNPALISGASLLVMTVLSLVVFSSLRVSMFSVVGIVVIIILDVIVAWGLYEFLKFADKTLAQIMAGLRVVYAGLFMYALVQISDLDRFNYIWDRSLALFGLHLLVLGILLAKAKYVPKLWGYLLVFTSVGYIVDGLGKFIGYTTAITMLTFWGEVLLGFWLAIKGRKIVVLPQED